MDKQLLIDTALFVAVWIIGTWLVTRPVNNKREGKK